MKCIISLTDSVDTKMAHMPRFFSSKRSSIVTGPLPSLVMAKRPSIFSKFLLDSNFLIRSANSRLYATATAIWIVPDSPPLSQDDVFDLIDFGENPVRAGTLAREVRKLRKRIQRPNRAFTDFTESWVASQLDILGARKVGGQDQPDILLHLPDGRRCEIAVKFCVRNDCYYDYTVAPERDGVVVIIIPRRLQFFVIPIRGSVVNEHLQLDNAVVRGRGGLVGIDELCKTVKEMIEAIDK